MLKMDLAAKKSEIGLVLSEPEVDLWKLRELCLTEGGLCDDTLRKRAWPKLVGLHGIISTEGTEESSVRRSGRSRIPRPKPPAVKVDGDFMNQLDDTTKKPEIVRPDKSDRITECLDSDQIDRDVARCTWHLLNGSQRSRHLQMENKHRKRVANLLRKKQCRLSNFINLTLVQANADLEDEDKLRYYQGFHDCACIFLSTLGGGGSGPIPTNGSSSLEIVASSMGLDLPSRVLGQVAKSHFRDAMRSNFIQLQVALRLILFPLLAKFDPELHSHLYYCEMEPFFALPWVITWFSHDIRDTELVKRLFDAFIVSHPLLPLYLSVAMILHPINRMEILSTDCDFASVHQTLAGLPKNSSMVGWRYKVADGYVSNDGEEEGSTASTDMDSTVLSEEFLDLMDDDGSDVPSMVSSSLLVVGSNKARVPFQELIDAALSYMRRVPPRKLMGLAKRYFAQDPSRGLLFEQAKSISLLQSPPGWGLAATAPSDWVLKQRLRSSRGMKPTSRRDRRSRSRSRAGETAAQSDSNDNGEIEKYLDEKQLTLAVIASGFGPGDDEEERRRRRRKLLMWGAVAAVIVAVSYAVLTHNAPSVEARGESSGDDRGELDCDLLQTEARPAKSAVGTLESIKQPLSREAGIDTTNEKPLIQLVENKSSGEKVAEFVFKPTGPAEAITKQESASLPDWTASVALKANVDGSALAGTGRANSAPIPAPVRFMKDFLLQARKLANDMRHSVEKRDPNPVPVRFMKDILLQTRRLANDMRHALEKRDPNLVPGAQFLSNFVYKVRQAIVTRAEAQDGARNDTRPERGGQMVQLLARQAWRCLTDKDTRKRGMHVIRNAFDCARATLSENEAEDVIL